MVEQVAKRRSRDGLPVPVPELAALVDSRLVGARCKGKAPLFDSLVPGETEEERRERHTWAAGHCRVCPVVDACAQVVEESPVDGIWAGEHRGRCERAASTGPRVRARERSKAA
jgi:WhiB family redox-sensing transcriptional regulator